MYRSKGRRIIGKVKVLFGRVYFPENGKTKKIMKMVLDLHFNK
jgi:hypothetical protein